MGRVSLHQDCDFWIALAWYQSTTQSCSHSPPIMFFHYNGEWVARVVVIHLVSTWISVSRCQAHLPFDEQDRASQAVNSIADDAIEKLKKVLMLQSNRNKPPWLKFFLLLNRKLHQSAKPVGALTSPSKAPEKALKMVNKDFWRWTSIFRTTDKCKN